MGRRRGSSSSIQSNAGSDVVLRGPAAIPGAAQESNLPALCFPAPPSFHSAYHSPQRVDFAPKIQCLLPRFCFSSLVFARAGCFPKVGSKLRTISKTRLVDQILHCADGPGRDCGSDCDSDRGSYCPPASKVWAAAAPAPTADKSSWEEWREIDRTQSHHQDEEHSHTIEIAGDGGGNTIVPLHP